jgi:hypothetical protein
MKEKRAVKGLGEGVGGARFGGVKDLNWGGVLVLLFLMWRSHVDSHLGSSSSSSSLGGKEDGRKLTNQTQASQARSFLTNTFTFTFPSYLSPKRSIMSLSGRPTDAPIANETGGIPSTSPLDQYHPTNPNATTTNFPGDPVLDQFQTTVRTSLFSLC